jgi:hypothetical protein
MIPDWAWLQELGLILIPHKAWLSACAEARGQDARVDVVGILARDLN